MELLCLQFVYQVLDGKWWDRAVAFMTCLCLPRNIWMTTVFKKRIPGQIPFQQGSFYILKIIWRIFIYNFVIGTYLNPLELPTTCKIWPILLLSLILIFLKNERSLFFHGTEKFFLKNRPTFLTFIVLKNPRLTLSHFLKNHIVLIQYSRAFYF